MDRLIPADGDPLGRIFSGNAVSPIDMMLTIVFARIIVASPFYVAKCKRDSTFSEAPQ